MRILVINPNTSESMTDHIRRELTRIKRPDTELTVVHPPKGPETIESAYDEAQAIPPTLELVKKGNREGFQAVILACFSDPGLEAAKEVSEIPVIGIEESTLHMAAMLGARFTVVTPRRNRVPTKRVHVHMRGLDYYLASVRCLDLATAEADSNPKEAKKRILKVARKAVEEDGAEIIILGCAGMAGYGAEIERKLKVKVLDPAAIGLKVAEAMADLGLAQSKRGLFATPPKKVFRV
jgi:allantoin racemase